MNAMMLKRMVSHFKSDHDSQKDKVILNTIAISSGSSEYMDNLIPISGGTSYSDINGLPG